MARSLYETIGGEAAVTAAVEIFYRKVMADPTIKRFFDGLNMEQQITKQKAFLTMVFHGPNNYTGLDMRTGHAHLVKMGLNDSHFDAVVEHLASTLKELKVKGKDLVKIVNIANSVRNGVLGR